jgi:hypothetical protein
LQGKQLAADSEAAGPLQLAPAADKAAAAAETAVGIEVVAAADVDIAAAAAVVVVLETQLRDSSC